MFREIDIGQWERRSAFEFFKDYSDPFFNVTADLDVTRLYRHCKANGFPYSLAFLYFAISTANQIREFRLRFVDEKVVEFDTVEATQTILNSDNTFSFSYYELKDDLPSFVEAAVISREKYSKLKSFDVESGRSDLIYFSAFPWVSFTSFKHAVRGDNRQTIPRMVFGKMFEANNARKMPFSVEVHHAMMDGYHVGKYYELLQERLDSIAV